MLGQAQQHYLASPDQARRYLNQGVFERIYIDDDEVVGSDLTPVFQRVMADDLEPGLAEERRRDQKRNIRTSDLYLVPGTARMTPAGADARVLPRPDRRARGRPSGRLPTPGAPEGPPALGTKEPASFNGRRF